jgi:hypothetical protein
MSPENDEYSIEMFERKRRRMIYVKIAVVVVPLLIIARYFAISISRDYQKWEAGLFDPEARERPLPPATKAEIQKLLADARARVEASDKAWRSAIEAASAAKLVERPDLGPCPVRVGKPPPNDEFAPTWLNQIKADDLKSATSNALANFRERASYVERELEGEHTSRAASRLLEEAKRIEGTTTLWEVTFLVDREIEPVGLLNEQYESGVIGGRAYLFDYRTQKVECAALVVGENSESVKFSFHTRSVAPNPTEGMLEFGQALKKDLRISTYREVAERMRFRAGPLAPEEGVPPDPSSPKFND